MKIELSTVITIITLSIGLAGVYYGISYRLHDAEEKISVVEKKIKKINNRIKKISP